MWLFIFKTLERNWIPKSKYHRLCFNRKLSQVKGTNPSLRFFGDLFSWIYQQKSAFWTLLGSLGLLSSFAFLWQKLVMLGQERIHINWKTKIHSWDLGKLLLMEPDMLSKLSKITSSQPTLQTLFVPHFFLPNIIISLRSDS